MGSVPQSSRFRSSRRFASAGRSGAIFPYRNHSAAPTGTGYSLNYLINYLINRFQIDFPYLSPTRSVNVFLRSLMKLSAPENWKAHRNHLEDLIFNAIPRDSRGLPHSHRITTRIDASTSSTDESLELDLSYRLSKVRVWCSS